MPKVDKMTIGSTGALLSRAADRDAVGRQLRPDGVNRPTEQAGSTARSKVSFIPDGQDRCGLGGRALDAPVCRPTDEELLPFGVQGTDGSRLRLRYRPDV